MGSIITFYSYKGGVGRTMALANIAALLVRRGKRVLEVDWDLEAPGLERYFADRMSLEEYQERGLLDVLMEAREPGALGRSLGWSKYVQGVALPEGCLMLLTSGKSSERYAANLESFDWKDFFDRRQGGEFFERLRGEWSAEFDFTLIDSRTGLSDSGGVCTILMPDSLVCMFTANHQSLYGVRDVIDLAQKARQNLVQDRMNLLVLPIPARWDGRGNVDEARQWLVQIDEVLGDCFSGWLPRGYTSLQALERLKVPQVGQFSFGEKLPVLTHPTSDPELPGYAYEMAASLIANDFVGAGALLGLRVTDQQVEQTTEAVDYLFDVYISYAHSEIVAAWIRKSFLPLLRGRLEMLLPRGPKFFVDDSELKIGGAWQDRILSSLQRSRLLLPILTPSYSTSMWCMTEWRTFEEKQRRTAARLIIPIAVNGRWDSFPVEARKLQVLDLSEFVSTSSTFQKSRAYLKYERLIVDLAENVADAILTAPPFDQSWAVVSPDQVDVDVEQHPVPTPPSL